MPHRKDAVACSTACSSLAHYRANRDEKNRARRERARAAAGLPADASETELRRLVTRRWRAPQVVSYATAHDRVRAERGPATAYRCVDCSGPAREWSYTHADPNERTEVQRDLRPRATRDVVLVRYSVDVDFYVPRCVSCHVKFDHQRALAG
jgi:hypothetical protein